MASKKKAKEPIAQREPTVEEQIFGLNEQTDYHQIQLEYHEHRIENLEEDLTGRDKVIWAILNQHNARIAALKHLVVPPALGEEETVEQVAVVLKPEEGAPTWFVILVLLGFVALAAVVVYGLLHTIG